MIFWIVVKRWLTVDYITTSIPYLAHIYMPSSYDLNFVGFGAEQDLIDFWTFFNRASSKLSLSYIYSTDEYTVQFLSCKGWPVISRNVTSRTAFWLAASCVRDKLADVDIRFRVLRFYLIGSWKWRFWKRHGTRAKIGMMKRSGILLANCARAETK